MQPFRSTALTHTLVGVCATGTSGGIGCCRSRNATATDAETSSAFAACPLLPVCGWL
ncbi:MAG: hypothetical protein ACI4QT_01595 [Kiritimatiellia bacterium]